MTGVDEMTSDQLRWTFAGQRLRQDCRNTDKSFKISESLGYCNPISPAARPTDQRTDKTAD